MDLCYRNIKEYNITCRANPPLGFADHNIISLLPLYTPILKRHKPQSVNHWSEDATALLPGSLACTDWEIFEDKLEERVLTITDYINFCISTTIPIRTCKRYPNSKPWIKHHVNHSFREKCKAFKQQDWASLQTISCQNKNDIITAKLNCKQKLEQ